MIPSRAFMGRTGGCEHQRPTAEPYTLFLLHVDSLATWTVTILFLSLANKFKFRIISPSGSWPMFFGSPNLWWDNGVDFTSLLESVVYVCPYGKWRLLWKCIGDTISRVDSYCKLKYMKVFVFAIVTHNLQVRICRLENLQREFQLWEFQNVSTIMCFNFWIDAADNFFN